MIFENEEETSLIKLFLEYESVLIETVEKNMPHILCKYIYDLTKTFSNFYNNIRILDENDESKMISRLKLVDYYAKLLKDSFSLLAIEMPEKM
jgi:arginyl-tRNA synthetase